MEKIDHKVLTQTYKYFLETGGHNIRSRPLQHDLQIDKKTLDTSIKRLEKLGYIECNNQSNLEIPYNLSKEGIYFAQKEQKNIFQKILSNTAIKWTIKVIGFILVYLLGLYTNEIKELINKLVGN